MRSESVTIVLDASRQQVYDFLSRVESMPEWATEFVRELRWVDGRPKAVNGLGELWLEIRGDPGTGVIDMFAGFEPGELALFPTRVVSLPGNRSAFTFTMFQAPDMPDDLFGSQHASLRRELEGLRERFAPPA